MLIDIHACMPSTHHSISIFPINSGQKNRQYVPTFSIPQFLIWNFIALSLGTGFLLKLYIIESLKLHGKYIYMTFFQRKLFRRHMESGEYYRFSMCFGLSLMPTFTFMTILHAHFLDSTTRQVIYSNRTKPFWIREIVPCAPKGKGDKSS